MWTGLVHTIGVIAQFKPDVLDKLNSDQVVDDLADKLGVNPDTLVGGKRLALIRDNRAQQAQQAQAMQNVQAGADVAGRVGMKLNG